MKEQSTFKRSLCLGFIVVFTLWTIMLTSIHSAYQERAKLAPHIPQCGVCHINKVDIPPCPGMSERAGEK